MKKNKKIMFIAQASIIAALYVVLTYGQEILLPGTTSMAVQFRVSEALTILACFTPAAIPGLTIGCFIANIINVQALPVDMIMGSAATFLAVLFMYITRNVTIKNLPVLSAFMPAIFNGIIIGLEIEIFFIEGDFHILSFLTQAGFVALGEFLVLFSLGLVLFAVIQKRNLSSKFFATNS